MKSFFNPARSKKVSVDVQAIYAKAPIEISEKQSRKFIRETNETLKSIQGYVLIGGSFKKLPKEEIGLFYKLSSLSFLLKLLFFLPQTFADLLNRKSVYVFLCSYFVDHDDDDSDEEEESSEEEEETQELDYVIYFWEGKQGNFLSFFLDFPLHQQQYKEQNMNNHTFFSSLASTMGWLKFKFGFQRTLESEIQRIFNKVPKVVRTGQQKEPAKLLAHFNQKIVVRNGERPKETSITAFKPFVFRIHCGLSHVHIRAVEVEAVFFFLFLFLLFSSFFLLFFFLYFVLPHFFARLLSFCLALTLACEIPCFIGCVLNWKP